MKNAKTVILTTVSHLWDVQMGCHSGQVKQLVVFLFLQIILLGRVISNFLGRPVDRAWQYIRHVVELNVWCHGMLRWNQKGFHLLILLRKRNFWLLADVPLEVVIFALFVRPLWVIVRLIQVIIFLRQDAALILFFTNNIHDWFFSGGQAVLVFELFERWLTGGMKIHIAIVFEVEWRPFLHEELHLSLELVDQDPYKVISCEVFLSLTYGSLKQAFLFLKQTFESVLDLNLCPHHTFSGDLTPFVTSKLIPFFQQPKVFLNSPLWLPDSWIESVQPSLTALFAIPWPTTDSLIEDISYPGPFLCTSLVHYLL